MTSSLIRNRRPVAIATTAIVTALTLFGLPASDATPQHSQDAARHCPRAADPPLTPLPSPSQFDDRIDNRYLPMIPGTRWVYVGRGSEEGERIVVRVLHRTRLIEGIRAAVVRDVATFEGEVIEKTFDWYAQDHRGNVWYLGEATESYEDGEVSTAGSWETGVDCARAGIVMPGHPKIGMTYWQEFYQGSAEDRGKILDLSTQVKVPVGHFKNVRMTEDTTPLEPRIAELKFYAPGVGNVLSLDISPELGSLELVRMDTP